MNKGNCIKISTLQKEKIMSKNKYSSSTVLKTTELTKESFKQKSYNFSILLIIFM
jgi:hypothetical protein